METSFTGRVWVLGDDIDTDIIIPTEYLALKTIDDMKQYGFSPLRPELAGEIRKGDIIVAGKNFGCGSSREQAPEIIKALGIQCVIAKSFARIFFRNSINNGLLLIEQPELHDACEGGGRSHRCHESACGSSGKTVPHRFPAGESHGYPESRRTGESHAETEWSGLTGKEKNYGRDSD